MLLDVVSRSGGRVEITGRSTGSTQLIAVTASGSKAFLITIGPPRALTSPLMARAPGTQPLGRYEGRYVSEDRQLQNVLDVFKRDGERLTHAHVVNIHYMRERFERAATAFPSLWYRVVTPEREVTLLDDFVDVSPLTLRSTQVRGLHLIQPNLEFHAGYAASTMYEDLFLPSDRRWTAGAGYTIARGATRWTPTIYGFFSEPENSNARRGVVASLIAERSSGDVFFVRGEVGVARSAGASGQFRYETDRDRAHGRVVFKPANFPTIGLSDLAGLHADADWTHHSSDRFTFDTSGSFDRFRIAGRHHVTATGNAAVRYALTTHLAVESGVGATSVRTPLGDFRTISVPVALAWDSAHFGSAVSYRMIDHSAASRRGDALRLSLRASASSIQANLWAERQRQAPTLSLLFNATPGLELALLRLGIIVRSPEDLARVLRDDAVLINLGVISGVGINLTPRRMQAGLNLAWSPHGPSRTRARLHTVYEQDKGVAITRETLLSTLSLSRVIVGETEIFAAYTRWQSRSAGLEDEGSSFETGIRTQFDALPTLLRRRTAIRGSVFLDPEITGRFAGSATPLSGITVMLDDTRSTITNAKGAYSFANVRSGPHRVGARLPEGKPAFFTTPSLVTADAPATVDFGLVWSPARLAGHILTDAGAGLAGAVINVAGAHGLKVAATTDFEGSFAVALPAGEYHVSLAAESLPPGYTISGPSEHVTTLESDVPQQKSFAVLALRSVSGTAAPGAEVELQPLRRKTIADAEGRYAFRSLPAGSFTIVARSSGRVASRTVVMGADPSMLAAIDVTMTAGAASSVARVPPARRDAPPAAPPNERTSPIDAAVATPEEPPPAAEGYRIVAGAYRSAANAAATTRAVMRLGLEPRTMQTGDLYVVTAGPYATRAAAVRDAARLTESGVPAYVAADPAARAESEVESRRMAFLVQLGAFRKQANASELMSRLRRAGERAVLTESGGLTIVAVGPFGTRQAAEVASERLRGSGFETAVIAR